MELEEWCVESLKTSKPFFRNIQELKRLTDNWGIKEVFRDNKTIVGKKKKQTKWKLPPIFLGDWIEIGDFPTVNLFLTGGISENLLQSWQKSTEKQISKGVARNHQELQFETAELLTAVHNLLLKSSFSIRRWQMGQQFFKKVLREE